MTIDDATLAKISAAARAARDNAYAPYSHHPVGAALLDAEGNIHAGANCENATYKGMACAERTAICAMATAGGRRIRAMTIVGPADSLIVPCGSCRQDIREFADDDTRVYCLKKDGGVGRVYTMDELLPDSFGPENMAEVGQGPLAKKGTT